MAYISEDYIDLNNMPISSGFTFQQWRKRIERSSDANFGSRANILFGEDSAIGQTLSLDAR